MKTGIATTLSVAGVIAAGAAAYAVNTSVLGATATNTPIAVAETTTSSIAPAAAVGAANTKVAVQSEVTNDSSKITTYKVGTAGSVVIDTTNGTIVVTNILPAAGYTSEPAQIQGDGTVKVRFVSSTQQIAFIARMVNGAPSVEVVNETPTTTPPPPPPNPGYKDHDDDDDDRHEDRHEDDDHDDEHDEDEDDD